MRQTSAVIPFICVAKRQAKGLLSCKKNGLKGKIQGRWLQSSEPLRRNSGNEGIKPLHPDIFLFFPVQKHGQKRKSSPIIMREKNPQSNCMYGKSHIQSKNMTRQKLLKAISRKGFMGIRQGVYYSYISIPLISFV